MARCLYSLLLYLAAPLIVGRLLWRARRQPEYLRHLGERLGFYGPAAAAPTLWLHAVSVGEARAAEPLLRALREHHPEYRLVLSCMTPTGRETLAALYGGFARVVYAPYDFPGASRRFLRAFRPRLGLLMETELWPNLIAAASAEGIPVALVNARLSARSAAGYEKYAALTRPAFAALAAVVAQTAADAARLERCGAPAATLSGNLKFDVAPAADKLALGARWRQAFGPRPVWLAASTREGEEALILEAYARQAHREVLLVLVPRHPQRVGELEALVAAAGLPCRRRSAGLPTPDCRVWLGDSLGEMAAYYASADLALIGGSLKPFGSQNLIEACACGCPVLVGPSDFNFAQAAADAVEAGAARRVAAEPAALATGVDALLADPPARQAMQAAARAFAAAHRGATEKTLAVVSALLAAPVKARAAR